MLTDAPSKLYALLLQSPQIALYIRDFTIQRSPHPNLWMQPNSLLPLVLPLLCRIKQFSIFGFWGDWLDIPNSLASAILHVISSVTLDRLHVLNVTNVPSVLLHNALSMRVLSLYFVGLNPTEDPGALVHIHRPQSISLEDLNLSLDSKVGGILGRVQALGSVRFANVRRLAVNPIPNSMNSPYNFARILSAVERTLERIDIQWYELSFQQFNDSQVDTSRLGRLRTVQLRIIMQEAGAVIPKYLRHAIHNLTVNNPRLESLTVVLYIPNVEGAEIAGTKSIARQLRKIDAELSGSFPALREARWEIVPECSPPNLVPDYEELFVANLSPHTATWCPVRRAGLPKARRGRLAVATAQEHLTLFTLDP
ncbi:hypothetical protein MSAN_00833200 [Mycena sanguinolenta]|uniref:Uncharacterized protein n=1 Tax=Mycena sanguinolenta TaxID=230812 RepID=A0A8H6YYN2_9AGAR|nr:hypothetical protein MSAN_00833200 [Mycena sanguinolenta]